MSPSRRNLLVGFVVLVALVVLGWMILAFAGKASTYFLTKGTPVSLEADRADGVTEGSAVMYRGVNVGRVMRVRLASDNVHVLIELLVNQQSRPLPANLRAMIKSTGLLGATASIYLETEGEPSNEPLEPGKLIVGHFRPDFTALADDLRQREVIDHIDGAVQSFHRQMDSAGQLLQSANKIVSDPKTQESIQTTLANMRSASESANRVGTNLESLTKQTSDTMTSSRKHIDELSKQVGDRMDQLADVLQHLQAITAKVDAGKGTMGKLVNDDKVYESLADTARELNLTVLDFRRLVEQWEQEGVSVKLGGK